MKYKAFHKQAKFHLSNARIRAIFAGKRGGKTEGGAIETIKYMENQPNKRESDVDEYAGAVVAPTTDMLRRLSLQKIVNYAKDFDYEYHKTFNEITWNNGTKLYGVSGDKPGRIEGLKLSFAWVDEIFQIKEQMFLELLARLSDTEGDLWVTGSLGVQYNNPKAHWVHKYFKEKPIEGSEYFEWSTAENPYFPKKELTRLKETLDPKTYRQLFTINWDTTSEAAVYSDFSDSNIMKGYTYKPEFETSIAIDWGWAHPMACLFFQYDTKNDIVILFDEIVGSQLKLEDLWNQIRAKRYRIDNWYCDIAGNQEREQTGYSNVEWFKKKNIHFAYRTSAVNYGVSLVRMHIKNGLGQTKFYVDEIKCHKSADGLRNYSYQVKDGIIINENPLKKDDDTVDAIRYFFVNRMDTKLSKGQIIDFNRWGKEWHF